ncbi:ATP-binding cassette domain-containing protein [Mesomycoplasma hyopneumoniae]|uniref:ATP-binding cassette domain-containing protein n=1 Tax=Mesomycoplasma hyopneumoniae TaxID=2099 RepID=UPI001EEDBB36|nr:ATP-binding cassette domain-containing protein [Mesomycoplasma hyopneumoniae]
MVQIKNLTKKFGPRKIFDNFSLEIPENKLVFITGESGIGKTTLINLIAGFTKKDGGEILFFKDGKEEKNPLIDVVFQDFNLINSFTGFELEYKQVMKKSAKKIWLKMQIFWIFLRKIWIQWFLIYQVGKNKELQFYVPLRENQISFYLMNQQVI